MRAFHIILLLSLMSPHLVQAAVQRYAANENDSAWKVETSPLLCALSHEIPFYGEGVFQRHAGSELEFVMKVKQPPASPGMAQLISIAPPWKHDIRVRDLGQVGYTVSPTPFRLMQPQTRRLLMELERGMFPTLSYRDWSDGRDEVVVALSAVNVRASLSKFYDCLGGVITHRFEDVRYSLFNYRSGQFELGADERSRLDEVALYLKADPTVRKVNIDSYTDNQGFRNVNKQVSKHRAETVRDYLVSKGVAAGKLAVHAYGELRPLASNRTAKGRARNRRVEVSLLK